MTKKTYILIASLWEHNYKISSKPVQLVLKGMLDELCQIFENDNPRFDRQKFITACGI